MMRNRLALVVPVLAVGLAFPQALRADLIRLKNGGVLEVEAWRELGDVIESAILGGIVGFSRTEVASIDGKPTRGDLYVLMYSAPPTAPAPGLDRTAAVKQMADLLKQGDGLAGQTVLSPAEKAAAFLRLGDAWRALQVPEGLREVHAKGQQALQLAAEAFTAEGEGTVPDAKERVEKAKTELQTVQDEVKKAGEQS